MMGPAPGPQRWIEVRVHVPDPDERAWAADLLASASGRAVEERGDTLVAHRPWSQRPAADVERLTAELADALGRSLQVEWSTRDGEAWTELWRRGLGVRRIGRSLVVKPTWLTFTPAPSDLVIELDPGMAFGTAEHATTRACLRLLEEAVTPGAAVLDVGTGSGILAIAAARLGAHPVEGVDVDPLALEAATENVRRNDVAVGLVHRDVLPGDPADPRWDVVVANMVSGLLVPRVPWMLASLRSPGVLITGGARVEERDAVVRAVGDDPAAEEIEDGWWSGRFTIMRD